MQSPVLVLSMYHFLILPISLYMYIFNWLNYRYSLIYYYFCISFDLYFCRFAYSDIYMCILICICFRKCWFCVVDACNSSLYRNWLWFWVAEETVNISRSQKGCVCRLIIHFRGFYMHWIKWIFVLLYYSCVVLFMWKENWIFVELVCCLCDLEIISSFHLASIWHWNALSVVCVFIFWKYCWLFV